MFTKVKNPIWFFFKPLFVSRIFVNTQLYYISWHALALLKICCRSRSSLVKEKFSKIRRWFKNKTIENHHQDSLLTPMAWIRPKNKHFSILWFLRLGFHENVCNWCCLDFDVETSDEQYRDLFTNLPSDQLSENLKVSFKSL